MAEESFIGLAPGVLPYCEIAVLFLLKISLQPAKQENAPIVNSDRLKGSGIDVRRQNCLRVLTFQDRFWRKGGHPPRADRAGLGRNERLHGALLRND